MLAHRFSEVSWVDGVGAVGTLERHAKCGATTFLFRDTTEIPCLRGSVPTGTATAVDDVDHSECRKRIERVRKGLRVAMT